MAEAYRVVRPIKRVLIWNIRPAGAERLAARLGAEAVTDLAAATAAGRYSFMRNLGA